MVIFIGQRYRANLDTISACGALGRIDIAGVLIDGNFEITGTACNAVNFSTGNQVDIEMPADLDQFGRDNSHGTIIGGKCFVEL